MQRDAWRLNAQTNELRAHCERQGWDVVALCSDEAISGSREDRHGFQMAISPSGTVCPTSIQAARGRPLCR